MRLKLIVGSLVLLNVSLLAMLLVRERAVPSVSAYTVPETTAEAVVQPAPAAVPVAQAPATEPFPEPPVASEPVVEIDPVRELPVRTEPLQIPHTYEPATHEPAAAPTPAPASTPAERPVVTVAQVRPAPEPPRHEAPRPPAPPPVTEKKTEPVWSTPTQTSVPAGTMLGVRLVNALHSRSLTIGQTFVAELDQDLYAGSERLAGAGSRVTGTVRDIVESGRVQGVETLVLGLDELVAEDGRSYQLVTNHATFTAQQSHKRDAVTIGGASVVGAIIGGIAKGGKGAATGAAAGAAAGAGVVLNTKGEPVHLEAGTQLMFTLQRELERY